MKAMVLEKVVNVSREIPLKQLDIPVPEPQENQVLIKVSACGVCRTDLDEIEGRTLPSSFPIIPGHQVVGRIVKRGKSVKKFKEGERVGIGWIFSSCGKCRYCVSGDENLCDNFVATGRDANGGYAEFMVAYEDFIYKIPEFFSDAEAAPLLCAGAIGWRSLRLAKIENDKTVALYGFGASGHIVIQIVRCLYPDSDIFVFTRSKSEQDLAFKLGARWAGEITQQPPEPFDIAIDTTPVWISVLSSLKNLRKGGMLVINAIRKENRDVEQMKSIEYEKHLWMEKQIKSVANVTRRDIAEFLQIAAKIPVKPEVVKYPLSEANNAVVDLKNGTIPGAKVRIPD
ncbi:MAG: zinc-dependent alcohol dehydrogenase family protein [Candidatus Omnitrophica bacterium]|nr:zinc-dependent alcohol dehydrogenase family protein [Candidatus Omnitrophota bacterium]